MARGIVPMDVYEWVHVFECLLRLGRLDAIDLQSLLYRPPLAHEHAWTELARRRMRADWLRVTGAAGGLDLDAEYRELIESYDRAGFPFERVLSRLGYGRFLLQNRLGAQAHQVATAASALCRQFQIKLLEEDVRELDPDDTKAPARQRPGPPRP